MENLEYYVLLPNINDERNYKFNVFRSSRFLSCLMDLKARTKKDSTINIKEEVKRLLQYSFWSRAEYEIMVKLLFGKEEHKIDVYEQIMLNYDLFYEYLISNWKYISAKTYRQQSNRRKSKGKEELKFEKCKQHDQDKISFAIEQLEKVKKYSNEKFEWWENHDWETGVFEKTDVSNAYFDIEANIEEQIKQLRELR